MNNLRQDLPDEGSRARVSEFFTLLAGGCRNSLQLRLNGCHSWNVYPWMGGLKWKSRQSLDGTGEGRRYIPTKGNGGLATPQGGYALIDWVNFKGEGTDIS